MRVPEGDLHCQCKLSIFSLSSFGPCIVFWILQKGTCIGKCIFSIFPAVTHQLKCKQTCIEKCRPRHKISMKKWLKIHQISKNVNLFPYTQYPIIRNGLIRNSAEFLGKFKKRALGRSNLRNASKNLRNGQCSDFQS